MLNSFLMHQCLNFRTAACDLRMMEPEGVAQDLDNNPAAILAAAVKQDQLDHICESCSFAGFRIKQLDCPVCHEQTRIIRGKPEKIGFRHEGGESIYFHFICKNCIRSLFCELDLLQ